MTAFDFEAFADGYIETALWADCMPYTDDMPEAERESAETGGCEDLDPRPGARERMIESGQLHDFVEANIDDLREYVQQRGDGMAGHAGHDFWLTRSGHGAGFWDRGLGDLGERLSEAARSYGSPDDHVPFNCGDGTFDA